MRKKFMMQYNYLSLMMRVRENDYESIVKRVENTFKDKQYLRRVSGSRQRWIDEDIEVIADEIVDWINSMWFRN